MYDLKPIIAKNISRLRTEASMTQSELASKLNYSDKAVSKWERAESIPDVCVLTEIADLFGVPLDSLVRQEETVQTAEVLAKKPFKRIKNKAMITLICVIGVWLVATVIFALADMIIGETNLFWHSFVWAVPASAIVWLVFNSIWFNKKRNYLIVSLLLWSVLAAVYLTALSFAGNFWQIFILGVPAQAIILAWSNLNFGEKHLKKKKKIKVKKTKTYEIK